MTQAYIGLGSNQGDRFALLSEAAGRLGFLPETRVTGLSPFYRSTALGENVGGEFLNAVAAVDTGLPPRDLLAALLANEKEMGRVRGGGKPGPRPIDLDLLLHGGACLSLPAEGDLPALTLPHPRLAGRLFVLAPLADLAPGLVVPGTGQAVSSLLARARLLHPEQWVERME